LVANATVARSAITKLFDRISIEPLHFGVEWVLGLR
jgi:hypothetical protein